VRDGEGLLGGDEAWKGPKDKRPPSGTGKVTIYNE